MSKHITQTVVFENTTPKALYDLYMDAEKHTIATAAPAVITDEAGAAFSLHGGYITGENIFLMKDAMIVQTWRGADWDEKEPNSIFIIELEPQGDDTILYAVHANVPEKHAESITKGWFTHYWEPWKKYLAGTPIDKHPTM